MHHLTLAKRVMVFRGIKEERQIQGQFLFYILSIYNCPIKKGNIGLMGNPTVILSECLCS